VSDEGLTCMVSANGGQLKRLQLSNCVLLTDVSLQVISECLAQALLALDISGCVNVTNEGVQVAVVAFWCAESH